MAVDGDRALTGPQQSASTAGPEAPPQRAAPLVYGVVGRGWRAEFYLRLARALPDRFRVAGVLTRDAEGGARVAADWGVPTVQDVQRLLDMRPELVVTSVPWALNPAMVERIAVAGVPVLSETPPAPDLPGLLALWEAVGPSGLVQVAEQYQFQPLHAARLALVGRGLIGQPTAVHLSSTHGYHAMSLIRRLLGVGFDDAAVRAQVLSAPLVHSLGPAGWPDDDAGSQVDQVEETLATLDFGGGRSGLYDFTDNQWWHPLRTHRHVVRGSHGEIVDSSVTTMADVRSPVTRSIRRRQTGVDGNLEGAHLEFLTLDGEVVWRNPYAPARLSDEEIAIAELLERTRAWLRDGAEAPYPLAQASQDHLLALTIADAVRAGSEIRTTRQPWAS